MNHSTQSCFHCGLPVPAGTHFSVKIRAQEQPMCCPGCQAVARAIVDNGLEAFYDHRTERSTLSRTLIPEELRKLELYDRPELQKSFVHSGSDQLKEASLILEGIVCAACVWLSEHHVKQLDGVIDFQVNYSTHRAQVKWDDSKIKLSQILKAIGDIGYIAHPLDPNRQEQIYKKERSVSIRRLAVAGLGAMQVMMLAVALYAGAAQGIDENLKLFLRWISLLITTPVLMYAARPFFVAAWRDIQLRTLGMDVPVALAIAGAYLASCWATLMRHGEVYFDSVTMFTFFLLLGRFLEMSARQRAGRAAEELVKLLPVMATRLEHGKQVLVTVADLSVGDIVLVKPGESIPADGLVSEGESSVDESLLTGESFPVRKSLGTQVIAGSVNIESPLQITINQVGQDTTLAAIQRLLERAQTEKPRLARLADQVAGYFVLAILLIAVGVGGYWYVHDPANAFWIVISILVVTCPCALSLATPTALTAATGQLTKEGMLTTRGHALETLARVNHFIFDKTGTLTEGKLTLAKVVTFAEVDEERALLLAASVEQHSEHPIAKVFTASVNTETLLPVTATRNIPGMGIEADIAQRKYFVGNVRFIQNCLVDANVDEYSAYQVLLADEHRVLAAFRFEDKLRADVKQTITQLHAAGIKLSLLSGDRQAEVTRISTQLGIENAVGELTPDGKLQLLQQFQQQGDVVAMIGDGINDAPVLSQAQVSIAMGEGTQIAHASADMILLSNNFSHLWTSIEVARRMRRVIKQNLFWALLYNLIALPLAAAGWVAPWMAAIGMSSSSLIVVLNALRLTRRSQNRDHAHSQTVVQVG